MINICIVGRLSDEKIYINKHLRVGLSPLSRKSTQNASESGSHSSSAFSSNRISMSLLSDKCPHKKCTEYINHLAKRK